MTTNAAGDVVIAAVSFGLMLVNPVTPGAGTTERYDTASLLAGTIETEAADFTEATAGPTGTKTATPTISAPWIAHTIALNVATNAALSVAATGNPSFSASLPAGDQTPTYTLPLTVQDTRTGAAAGWKLTITSTQLTGGTHSLATTASTVTGVTSTCAGGALCVAPTNSIPYPFSVPAGAGPPTAVKLFNAAANTGTGVFSIAPTVKVSVPANSYAGTYTSSITVAVVTGP